MLTEQAVVEESTNQQIYEALFSNILYEDIELTSQGITNGNLMYEKKFIYTHVYFENDEEVGKSFYIDTGVNVSLIQVCYYDDSSECPYTVNNFSRVIVYSPPTDNSFETRTTYIIKVGSTGQSIRPSIIAHTINEPITILHNQEHVYTYDPYDNSLAANANSTVLYTYHTLTNILLFV